MTAEAPLRKPNFISRLAHPGEFMRWTKPLVGPLAVVIRDGVVERVVPDGEVDVDLPELDAGGAAVIPGFVT